MLKSELRERLSRMTTFSFFLICSSRMHIKLALVLQSILFLVTSELADKRDVSAYIVDCRS